MQVGWIIEKALLCFLIGERQDKEAVDGVVSNIFKRGINGKIVLEISVIGLKQGHDVLTVLGVLLVMGDVQADKQLIAGFGHGDISVWVWELK